MASGGITVKNDGVTPAVGGSALVATQDGILISGVTTEVQVMSTASAKTTIVLSGVTVSGATTSLLSGASANNDRKSFVIQSFPIDGTGSNATAYISDGTGTPVSTGIALLDGDTYTDDRWIGPVSVHVPSGVTAYIRYWERK